ncbi:MAG: hypothetical protein NTW08_08250 [Gammaproteobacteria bacterium]|nr:hypothetical protein [Gammaproteobacteria bacterium]
MLKQFFIYLAVSILVLIFSHVIQLGLGYLLNVYHYLSQLISPVFNQVGLGRLVHQVILLTLIPICIAGIPKLGYQLVKGQALPHFIEITWCIWLTLMLTLLLH